MRQNGDGCLGHRMVHMAHEREAPIISQCVEDRTDTGIQLHPGQPAGLARELGIGLIQVVEIQVHVSKRMHELTGFESGHLRDHQCEQRIGRDVERFTAIHPTSSREPRRCHTPACVDGCASAAGMMERGGGGVEPSGVIPPMRIFAWTESTPSHETGVTGDPATECSSTVVVAICI